MFKLNRLGLLLTLFTILFTGCKDSESSYNNNDEGVDPPVVVNSIDIGRADTFEAVTWNLKNFPTDENRTVEYLTKFIPEIGADIFAIQEIAEHSVFIDLVNQLPNYDGIAMTSDYYQNLGFIYNPNTVNVISYEEIMEWEEYYFLRIPLLLTVEYDGNIIHLITVHFKANDDGSLDESKRRRSCQLLDEYVTANLNDAKVIILGDMNDELTDEDGENVFEVFLEDTNEYLFADMEISQSANTGNASYPSYPSHIDHILITNELFPQLAQENSLVQTLLVDYQMDGGLGSYRSYISDHRPVAIRLDMTIPTALKTVTWNIERFPKLGDSTINEVTYFINTWDADYYGLQEIANTPGLMDLADDLPNYTAYVANYFVYQSGDTYNPPVGCLIKSTLNVTDTYTILDSYDDYREFPRSPLVVEATFGNEELVFINIHLKAAGDNYIDSNDLWDEETRRLGAMNRLAEFITTHYGDKKVILVGDLNDRIQEGPSTNVFTAFLDAPLEFQFADMEIALDPQYDNYSYPENYPSHIDHILITNELFDYFDSSDVEVLTPDYDVSSWGYYESVISDHRPVSMILNF